MKKYILFDLDGTLTDPRIGITTCVQYALESFGIHEPDLTRLEPFIGPPLLDSFMQFYGFSKMQAQEGVKKYRERFQDVGLYENEIYPGIEHMLKTLHKKGFSLTVASSKPTVFVEKILEYFHIRKYFQVVMGSELDGRRSKKEEVIREALHQLFPKGPVPYDQIYMVGDRKFDVEGAKRIHVESIGVTYGYGGIDELKECKADYIVESVGELEDFILRELHDSPKEDKKTPLWPMICFFLLYLMVKLAMSYCQVTLLRSVSEKVPQGLYKLLYIQYDTGEISISEGMKSIISIVDLMIAGGLVYLLDGKKQIALEWKNSRLRQIRRKKKYVYLIAVLCGICSAIGINGLIRFSGLIEKSQNYQDVAANQFAGPVVLGLLCYGIVAPIAEEILFRGIIYSRARRHQSFEKAALFSAIFFAIFHMNIVQGIYAFLMGLVIAYFYDYFGSIWWAILTHMLANTVIYLIAVFNLNNSVLFSLPVAIIFTLVSMAGIWQLWREKRKY